jgi:hypothetical protein
MATIQKDRRSHDDRHGRSPPRALRFPDGAEELPLQVGLTALLLSQETGVSFELGDGLQIENPLFANRTGSCPQDRLSRIIQIRALTRPLLLIAQCQV